GSYSPPRHRNDVEEADEHLATMMHEGSLTREQYEALFTPPALVSPTTAEKVLGTEVYPVLVADLVTKPDKRPVVAREGDRRSKWEGKAPEDMFADETGEE